MPAPQVGAPDYNWQDLRVAVVLTGGVSLAVWMSGVTHELNRMVSAGRTSEGTYGGLLRLLRARPRIDVITGTSAGGINGAFLALAVARRRDLGLLREVWRSSADLGSLLRDPLRRDPPALLRGDDYLLVHLADELRALLGPDGGPTAESGNGPLRDPVELFLTGTLWSGRTTSFTDDMGASITELDRDATFRFATGAPSSAAPSSAALSACGDLDADGVVDELAVAARCSSSFPGAFEPHWVEVGGGVPSVGPDGTPRWASKAGQANFSDNQFVLDGGVLHNKPIRPAIDAIYRQTADLQVRRVLAYVVPDSAEPDPAQAAQPAESRTPSARQPTPSAPDVLLGLITRLFSTESVARDLAEIRDRNASVAARRRARMGLAAAMTDSLTVQAWPEYVEARAEHEALRLAALLAAGQQTKASRAGGDRWSEAELVAAVRRHRPPGLGSPAEAGAPDWDWDAATVHRLGDLTLDVLKRALKLSRLETEERAEIVERRGGVWTILAATQADGVRSDARWTACAAGSTDDPVATRTGPLPLRSAGPSALDRWVGAAFAECRITPAVDPGLLHGHALGLARELRAASDALTRIASGADADRLAVLVDSLLADTGTDEEVLGRMLRLDVVQLAFAGTAREVEQEVELVQMSSLDPGRLTGSQLYHFGAFYREHWRVNDWIQGRMDGAVQIARMLLDPERLRQIEDGSTARAARAAGTAGDPADALLGRVRAVAVPAGDPDETWFAERWSQSAEAVSVELTQAVPGTDPVGSPVGRVGLDATARAVALPAQVGILREDLGALAAAIRTQGTDAPRGSRTWLTDWEAVARPGTAAPAATLWKLWDEASAIGRERITDDVGSDTFARTTATFAAVGASAIQTLGPLKVLGAVLSAFRGYTLLLWTLVGLLTRESRFGARAVQLALAIGAALVAVAVVTPGVPFGFPLVGAVLLLVGFTAAALLTRQTWRIAVRLVVVAVVVLAGVGALIAQRVLAGEALWSSATIVSALVKAAVVIGIVALGWWVSGARRR
jgi:patatin-related protein